MRAVGLAALIALAPTLALADDPPVVEHQPVPCTIAGKAISLCATISDDNQLAKARLYFRRTGEDFYSFVDMVFTGLSYCGTIPGVIEGKAQSIDYYVNAVDDQYQPQRTSTFLMNVQPEGVCEFPPIEKDAARAASIKIYATSKKQGKKLDDAFNQSGVTFVPVVAK
jgi:hypothetical protein